MRISKNSSANKRLLSPRKAEEREAIKSQKCQMGVVLELKSQFGLLAK